MKEYYKNVIYLIVNILNNHFYLGSAINYKARNRQHCFYLNKKKHHSIYLQRAWEKYKSENFGFFIIEWYPYFTQLELLAREEYLIKKMKPEYNIVKTTRKFLQSHECRAKAAFTRSKEYIIMLPSGVEVKIKNLKKFCKENNLTNANMYATLRGKQFHHKNFRIRKENENYKYIKKQRSMHNFLKWEIYFPSGKKEIVIGLNKRCKELGLCSERMRQISKLFPNKEYKNYKCRKI